MEEEVLLGPDPKEVLPLLPTTMRDTLNMVPKPFQGVGVITLDVSEDAF